MKKMLFAIFNIVFVLLVLSSGLADTGKTFDSSSNSESLSDYETSEKDLVIIEPDTEQGTNGKAISLTIIDDVLIGSNPSPLVSMGKYQMKDPESLSEVIPAESNETEILDGIPNNLKPSPLLPMGVYEITEDDLAALWVGVLPESFFLNLDENDYASVGHLVDLAENAAAELNSRIPGGAGSEINDMVAGFKTGKASDPEEREVTAMVGQVINVARPFYERLHGMDGVVWPNDLNFIGGNGKYPWSDLSENAGDTEKIKYYAFAKKGQINSLFSWGFSSVDTEDTGNENANNDLDGTNSGNILLNHNLHGQTLIQSSIVERNSAFDADKLSTLQASANEGEDKNEKSIYEYAGVIQVNVLSRMCWANDMGGSSYWPSPLPSASRSYHYITLGDDYVVQDCYFLSDLVGQEYAGTSKCYGAIPEKTTFNGIPTTVTYYIRSHNCSGGYENGDHSGYGKATATTSLLSSSVGGEVHQFGTPHTRISCGTSFAPWVWGIEKSQAQSKNIQFGRKYQTNDNTQGKRVIKVDHSSSDITVTCKGNFSFETKKVFTPISTPTFQYYGYTTEITITPGSVAGQYEGELTIVSRDTYTNYREIYKLSHSGDAARTITYPFSESSGPKYRKISLLGRPINDDKPQSEEESDFMPPETFVDALSQALRHNVNDYIQTFPGSELTLAVRRNYTHETWNTKSGLEPHQRPELAFGLGWETNLVSYIRFEQFKTLTPTAKRTDPDYVTVVDENGMPFRFAVAGGGFYPMPNDRSDAQAFLNSLTHGDDGKLIFKKKYGTTLTYEPSGLPVTRVLNDKLEYSGPSETATDYSYYRLVKVEDRNGTILKYQYDDTNPGKLIPSRIQYDPNTGRKDIALTILQDSSGRITQVTAPSGNIVNYTYEKISENSDYQVLKSVKKGGASQPDIFTYSYEFRSEMNPLYVAFNEKKYESRHSNLDLSSIVDGVGNEYAFTYKPIKAYYFLPNGQVAISGGGVYSRQNSTYYVPAGAPGKVEKITIKQDGELVSQSTFDDNNSTVILSPHTYVGGGVYNDPESEEEAPVAAKKMLTVTDGVGNKVRYTWANPGDERFDGFVIASEMASFKEIYGFGYDDPFSSPSMVYYAKMIIDYMDDSDTILGTETVTFDIDAGMAISSHTDMYGNTTTFTHDELLPVAETSTKGLIYASRYSDPTSQTDAAGNVTEFTYDATTRVMSSVKVKKAGEGDYARQTIWTISSKGHRTNEKIYGADGELSKEIDNFFGIAGRFSGFLCKSIVYNGAGTGQNLVTDYGCDDFGYKTFDKTTAGSTSYSFDRDGSLSYVSDPNRNYTYYTYDKRFKKPSEIRNSDGTTKTYAYDAIGRKLSEKNENGNTTFYEYNALHKITKVTKPLGVVSQTEYNAVGMPVKVTDPNGNKTEFEYDALLRLVKKTQYSGDTAMGITTYEYGTNSGSSLFSSDNFKPTKITNTRGYVSQFTYDSLYRLIKSDEEYAKADDDTSTYSGDGIKTTVYEYDVFGNKISETDDNENKTSYEYNALDKVIKTTFADNSSKLATYTAGGLLSSETDEMGKTTNYEYDLAGRLIKKTFPEVFDYNSNSNANPIEEMAYDAVGNLTGKTDPLGNVTNFTYDNRNRIIKEEKASVRVGDTETFARPTIVTTYDNVGNKTSVTDPNGNITTFEYDALNRLVKTTFPPVNVAQYTGDKVSGSVSQVLSEFLEYDANGNITKKTDTAGNETVTTYNYQNKPLTVTNPPLGYYTPNPTDAFEYDTEGNLVSITDMGGIKTVYEYDGLNRKKKALYYATASTENQRSKNYKYDGLNLRSDGSIYYVYDRRNRVSKTGQSESYINFTYTYDKASRITHVSGFGSFIATMTAYEYDANGLVLKEKGGDSSKYNLCKYDLSGNKRFEDYMTYDYPTSTVMQEETVYDSNNRVTEIKDEQNRITRYYYDLNGNVTKKVYPNGDIVTREYDALNRLLSANTTNNEAVTLSCEYVYDAGGNLAYFTQACDGKTQAMSMKYDSLDRLTNEYGSYGQYEEGQYKNSYTYSGYKLISQYTYRNGSNGINYKYKPETMMLDEVSPQSASGYDNIVKFTYDSMANISKIVKGNKTNEFVFNHYGWLVGSHEYGTPSVYSHTGYTYDYRGRRIIKIVAATTIETSNYWYSGGVCVMETSDKTGRRLFYRGPDMGGGVGGINYSCKADGTDLNYKHYSLRGDVIATTDSAGSVLSQSQYEAYGEHVDFGTMPADKYRANTKVEDPETNLLLEGHRYRHLEYKTFMSPDPLEYGDGLNFYAYCGFNPWGRFDPVGLDAYILSWFTKKGDFGHSGIAFDRYKKETKTEMAPNGSTKTTTSMVPTGEVTYYDLWPGNEGGVGRDNYNEAVSPFYTKGEVMHKDELAWFIPDDDENSNMQSADGIVILKTNYEQDKKMEEYAEGEIKKNTKYVGDKNNCSTFVQNVVRNAYSSFNAEENIPIDIGMGINWNKKVATPNKIYNEARKIPNSVIERGRDEDIDPSYKSYSGGKDEVEKK